MIYILAIALKSRVDFLFTEMQGISPIDISILHQGNFGIATAIFSFEETVIQARVNHQQNVIKIKRVSDGMFI